MDLSRRVHRSPGDQPVAATPVDDPCIEIVLLHHGLDAHPIVFGFISGQRSDFFLKPIRQAVQISPAHQVDQHAHPLHETGRGIDALLAVRDELSLPPELRQPSARQDIPESARALLQVRFQMEDGVLEILMALTGQAVDSKTKFLGLSSMPTGKKVAEKEISQCRASGYDASIRQ